MKNVEKLLNVVEIIDNEEAIRLLREFILDNTPKTSKASAKINFKRFVAKDNKDCLRPILQYVFHDIDNKVAVATDAHKLLASKSGYIEASGEEEDIKVNGRAGVIRDLYGQEVKGVGRYPNWKAVIPDVCQPLEIDGEHLSDLLQEAKVMAKGNKCKPQKLHIKVADDVWQCYDHAQIIVEAGCDDWYYSERNHTLVKWCDNGDIILLCGICITTTYGDEHDIEEYKTREVVLRQE